jgi:hypothetical protein
MERKAFGLMLILLVLAWGVNAEETFKAKKWDNPEWYYLVHVDFEPGKTEEAIKLINEHFAPASKEAGTPGPCMMLIHHTGEWNMTFVWHMKDGAAGLDWEISPDEEKWMAALVKREGGMEKAMELINAYRDLIEKENAILVRNIPFLEEEKTK